MCAHAHAHAHARTHAYNLICEKLNQHSCNNSALIVLLPSLSRLHSIFNQASSHFLCSAFFCPFALSVLPDSSSPFFSLPLLFNLALVTVKFIYQLGLCSFCQFTRPQISPLHSPHTIMPSLPCLHTSSLVQSLSPCTSLPSQQLAEHVLPRGRRASSAQQGTATPKLPPALSARDR